MSGRAAALPAAGAHTMLAEQNLLLKLTLLVRIKFQGKFSKFASEVDDSIRPWQSFSLRTLVVLSSWRFARRRMARFCLTQASWGFSAGCIPTRVFRLGASSDGIDAPHSVPGSPATCRIHVVHAGSDMHLVRIWYLGF